MLVVQKFGGSSVADAARVRNVAKIVTDTYKAGNDVVVVVSAQGDTTDDLIEKAKEINPRASKREMDMLLSAGEQISISLLAMAIESIGCPVISLLGWQAGFRTNSTYASARIKRVDPERIRAARLDEFIRVLGSRNAQHLDLQITFFQDVDRALCRRLTGSVCVIRDDNAVGMPRDNARLLLGQRGAKRCNRGIKSRLMQRDDIHIALG